MMKKKIAKQLTDKIAKREEEKNRKEFKKNLLNFIKKCERNDEVLIK